MSKPISKQRRVFFRGEENALRELFDRWKPIGTVPFDEMDCLVHHILSKLHLGGKLKDIQVLISNEFHGHFGIDVSEEEIRFRAGEIWTWWNKERQRDKSDGSEIE